MIRKTLPKSNMGPITATPFSSSATSILSQPKSAFSFTAFSSAAMTSVSSAASSNNILQVANQMQKVAEEQKQLADTKITSIMNELFKHVPRSEAPISILETIDARMSTRDYYSDDLCSDLPLTDAQVEEKTESTTTNTTKKSNKRSRKGKEEPATATPATPIVTPSPTSITNTTTSPPPVATPKNTKSRKKPKKEK